MVEDIRGPSKLARLNDGCMAPGGVGVSCGRFRPHPRRNDLSYRNLQNYEESCSNGNGLVDSSG